MRNSSLLLLVRSTEALHRPWALKSGCLVGPGLGSPQAGGVGIQLSDSQLVSCV